MAKGGSGRLGSVALAATLGLLLGAAGCLGASTACDCPPPMDTRYFALSSQLPAAAASVHADSPCEASLAGNEVVLSVYPHSSASSCNVLLTLANGDQYAATATFHEYTGGCCGDLALFTDVPPFAPRE